MMIVKTDDIFLNVLESYNVSSGPPCHKEVIHWVRIAVKFKGNVHPKIQSFSPPPHADAKSGEV